MATLISENILRAYDIRGVAGRDLTEDVMTAIGQAFATELLSRGGKSAAVGYDGRLSSPALADALTKGLVSSGADVVSTGRGPSPMLYFASHHLQTDAGLMITGSHNPPDHNGLKMTMRGHAFFGDDIQTLGDRARCGDFSASPGSAQEHPIFDDYVDRLLQDFRPGRPLRVAWDPGNGAGGEVCKALTDRLPGTHVLINETIDGTFPAHHPDPTVEANLAQLKSAVAEYDCDLGIAFDGDADRIGVIDSKGRVLWGDQLLSVLAREVLDDLPGARIVCDVKASRLFFDEVRRLGGTPVMYKSGHSHIKTHMAEIGAPLAGEMSAHIFFKHRYYGFDDALYAAVRLLSILGNSDESVADIIDGFPTFFTTPEVRFDCPDEAKFDIVDRIAADIKARSGIEVIDLDGLRIETDEGWWLLRASNTQPMLTLRVEASSEAGLRSLKEEVRSILQRAGVAPPAF